MSFFVFQTNLSIMTNPRLSKLYKAVATMCIKTQNGEIDLFENGWIVWDSNLAIKVNKPENVSKKFKHIKKSVKKINICGITL